MARELSSDAEELLDKEFKVLNAGFVRLVDYLGGDKRVVQAARVSYGDGTKTLREDAGLISYLMKNEHTSPFEQVVLTFHIKTPIFVARQWVRHRTARLNEISGRYSVLSDEFYVPEPSALRTQSKTNKQGRDSENIPNESAERILNELAADQAVLYSHYEGMVNNDLARELARINLPVSLYTQFYWQIDLHNLFRFLRLRLDSHAQFEIQEFARAIALCTKSVAPICYAAFEEHWLHAVKFSSTEFIELRRMLDGESCNLQGKKREEFLSKLGIAGSK